MDQDTQLTPGQIAVADKIIELLAESPLAEEIKDTLVQNIEKLPAGMILELLKALEAEDEAIRSMADSAVEFLKQQEEDWKKLEQDQKAALDEISNQVIKDEERKAQIQQLKDSIQ
jgi:hypothetical protein